MLNDNEIMKIAENHWVWIEGLFESMPDDTVFGISATEYLYKTAFVHGWKHASQSIYAQYATKLGACPCCGRIDGSHSTECDFYNKRL